MTAGGKQKPRYGFGDIVMLTACHGPVEAANLTVPDRVMLLLSKYERALAIISLLGLIAIAVVQHLR